MTPPSSTVNVSALRARLGSDGMALFLLGLLLLLVAAPVLLQGHVIVPLANRSHFYDDTAASHWPELPRLADVNRQAIPMLQLHFQGDHDGWIATWNPYIQLGKPASHIGGYSKIYPLTYIVSFFTRDPYLLHTWLAIWTLALLTLFAFLFLRSIGLHPAAAFIGAVGIGLNTRSVYWLGFTLFLAWPAWSMAILWLSVRLIRRPRLSSWLGLVFCCFCMILGARHQAIIRMAYLIVPFVLSVVLVSENTWRKRGLIFVALGLVPVASIALGYPFLHDLLAETRASSRFGADTTDFIMANWASFFEHHLAMLWNAFVFGNPSSPEYPINTTALNFTPFYFSLFAVVFVDHALLRRTWLFVLLFLFFLAMSISPQLYLFAIKYMGFGFSRSNPVGGLYIPVFIVCAYVADTLLADRERRKLGVRWSLLAIVAATALGVASVFSHSKTDIHWGYFILGLTLAAASAAFVRWRSPLILYGVAVVIVAAFVAPSLVHRPLEDVVRSTPLIREIQQRTLEGHRFAKFGGCDFLPSNEEVLVNVRSIHSYDSLSAAAYGQLTTELSDRGIQTHGRHFDCLDSEIKLRGDSMSYTGVSAILSDRHLPLPSWSVADAPRGKLLYWASDPPPLVAQIVDFEIAGDEVTLRGPLQMHVRSGWAEVVERQDNRQVIKTRDVSQTTLLFLSIQFHPEWVARSSREELTIVRINRFYLGVLLSPGTTNVELRFEPLMRWAWIPLLFFAAAMSLVLVWELVQIRHRSRKAKAEI